MNIANTIIAKSDQLNGDDIISGPIVIEITGARPGPQDQPVWIDYAGSEPTAENKDGRPYKPNKTMRKILSCIWGDETDEWIGRRLKLYRDEHVKWGGKPVGGIVIEAASHIGETRRLSLNETRNKKKMYVIEPLPDSVSTSTTIPKAPKQQTTEEPPKKPSPWDQWFIDAGITAEQFREHRIAKGQPSLRDLTPGDLQEIRDNPVKYGDAVRATGQA